MTKNYYEHLGVSSSKKEINEIIELKFPKDTFCVIHKEENIVKCLHSDTCGTKPILHYLYWKDTGDLSWWKYLAWDALAMNINDISASGFTDNILANCIISRNKNLIPQEVIAEIIMGMFEAIEHLRGLGININHLGGETADVGDIVKTIDVGASVSSSLKEEELIKINIQKGDVIVSIPSWGKTYYEPLVLSGISCNGISLIRHVLLSKKYKNYPEAFDSFNPKNLIYRGSIDFKNDACPDFSTLLLSPTRFCTPILKELFKKFGKKYISGIIHITGGAHTKILHFIRGKKLKIYKEFKDEPPYIFKLVEQTGYVSLEEMYSVFNMGYIMDIFVRNEQLGEEIASFIRETYSIPATIIGNVTQNESPCVEIQHNDGRRVCFT